MVLKCKVVLKWRYMYICVENIRTLSLIAGLKIEGIVKWKGLKSQGPLIPNKWYFGTDSDPFEYC